MPGSAARILITERQQKVLQDIAHSRTAPLHLTQGVPIILRAFEGTDNQDIAGEIDLNQNSVGVWRWAQAWMHLTIIKCTGTQADLRRAIDKVLSDEPYPGNPGKLTPKQIAQILELACEPPEKSGRASLTGRVIGWPTKPRSGALCAT